MLVSYTVRKSLNQAQKNLRSSISHAHLLYYTHLPKLTHSPNTYGWVIETFEELNMLLFCIVMVVILDITQGTNTEIIVEFTVGFITYKPRLISTFIVLGKFLF